MSIRNLCLRTKNVYTIVPSFSISGCEGVNITRASFADAGRKIISSLTETREVYRVQSRQMFGPALSAYVSNMGRLPCKGLREIVSSY